MELFRVLCLIVIMAVADFNSASRITRVEKRIHRLEDRVDDESKFRREDMWNLFEKIDSISAVLNMSAKNVLCHEQEVETPDEDALQPSVPDSMQITEDQLYAVAADIRQLYEITELKEQLHQISDTNNKSFEIAELRMQTAEDHFYTMLNETRVNQIKLTEQVSEISELKNQLLRMTEIDNNSFEIAELKNRLNECTETCNLKTETSTLKIETSMQTEISTLKNETSTLKTKESTMKNERFQSCVELYEKGHRISGEYDVYPNGRLEPIRVFCDQDIESGGGWTVFQRRKDGSENFFRGWLDYKLGFGDLDGEFWLGNENLSTLTSKCCSQLRIEIENSKGERKYAMYNEFQIRPADERYSLKVSGYSGNVNDALAYHNGSRFTTKDVDGGACAVSGTGAWWYKDCFESNLNGQYLSTIYWDGFQDHPLIFTEMKFRRHVN